MSYTNNLKVLDLSVLKNYIKVVDINNDYKQGIVILSMNDTHLVIQLTEETMRYVFQSNRYCAFEFDMPLKFKKYLLINPEELVHYKYRVIEFLGFLYFVIMTILLILQMLSNFSKYYDHDDTFWIFCNT